MNFERFLFNNAVPEWRPGYVDYALLTDLINAIASKCPRPVANLHPEVTTDVSPNFQDEGGDPSQQERERLQAIESSREEASFIRAYNCELKKVSRFFEKQIGEALKTLGELEAQLAALYVAYETGGQHEVTAVRSKRMRRFQRAVIQRPSGSQGWSLSHLFCNPARALQGRTKQLERCFQEYYRHLDMLRAYRKLNQTALHNLAEMHDEVTGLSLSTELLPKVDTAGFMTTDLEKEIRRVEQVFTDHLAHGDRRRAMQKLHVPVDSFQPFDWTTFGLGLWAMFFFFCMVIILLIAFTSHVRDYPDNRVMFAMYRGLLYPLIMLAFVATNMYVWRKHHINYVLIFGLDHRQHTNYIKMLHTAGLLMAVWSLSVFAYLFHDALGVDVSPWSAVALLCFLAAYWFQPWGSMRAARLWLARVVGRVITAPLLPVRFEDFWLADQFNSMTVILLDLEFLVCYVAAGQYGARSRDGHHCRAATNVLRATIAALPAWWRFAQCLRRFYVTGKWHHFHNAIKYSTSIIVVIFSTLAGVAKDHGKVFGGSPVGTALFILWGLACLVNTTYSAFWDLRHDWGLFRKDAKYKFLRRDLLYPHRIYYLAMVNNVLFRLSWTLSISVGYFDLFFSDGLVAVLAFFEMWRRFCWNFFRLENEHLNNCGEFRAVRRIPMPFEYAPAESEHMLDGLSGVEGREKGSAQDEREAATDGTAAADAFGGRSIYDAHNLLSMHQGSRSSKYGSLGRLAPQMRMSRAATISSVEHHSRSATALWRSCPPREGGFLHPQQHDRVVAAPPGTNSLSSTERVFAASQLAASGSIQFSGEDDEGDADDPSQPLLLHGRTRSAAMATADRIDQSHGHTPPSLLPSRITGIFSSTQRSDSKRRSRSMSDSSIVL